MSSFCPVADTALCYNTLKSQMISPLGDALIAQWKQCAGLNNCVKSKRDAVIKARARER